MDLRNSSCLISTSGHHWERDGSRQKPEPLDNWIRCLSSANQKAHHKHWIVFSAYTKWVVFCIVHCMMQSAMMAYMNVQCILDCLPVSVSTEPVYSDDQFANSYSNPYKLYINGSNGMLPAILRCAIAQWQSPYTFPYKLHNFEL